ncbi:MAG: cysteine desulfurase [Spirochaetota bacterium]|nr:cysteine desulfurase [Spirochaetota bacterium]
MESTVREPQIDIEKIRNDFPMLSKKINDKPLIYLDNAATTHKPWSVINCVKRFDSEEYATVRRGAYKLGELATTHYEEVRKKIATFLGVTDPKQIIFTSGTTQSINLVAHSFGRQYIKPNDEVIISTMEHHANIIPWQIMCEERGAKLKIIPINDQGELIMEEYDKLLSSKTKLVSVTHVSNALGTINPIKEIIYKAHSVGARVLIDGAQSTPHMNVNISELDCDFYAFSGHKMYAPSGVGVLFGKLELLSEMPPYVTGGEMINLVTLEKTSYAKPPARFEAGTPPISQVIGLGEAIDYINNIGLNNISAYENQLLNYGTKMFSDIPGLKIIGTAKNKASIISFTLENAHPHDILTLLDEDFISVRGGHHCAQPVMRRFNVPATTRASMSFYNTYNDLDVLASGLRKVIEVFS